MSLQYLRNNRFLILITCHYSHSMLTSKHKLNTQNYSELHKNSIQKSPPFLSSLSKNCEISTNMYFTFFERTKYHWRFQITEGHIFGDHSYAVSDRLLHDQAHLHLKMLSLLYLLQQQREIILTKTNAIIIQIPVKPMWLGAPIRYLIMWLGCTNSVPNYVAGLH